MTLFSRNFVIATRYRESFVKTMQTFCGRVNPAKGSMDWVVEGQDYDYHQEIARSSYADMLHDDDRNKKYYLGIQAAIKRMKEKGKKPIVLDIGTGTGLLSMMAVEAGAVFCYAIEVFKPMAEAAMKIVGKNGMMDKIKVINKHSTAVKVGPGADMEEKANVLITELFDSELIGEGALPSYEHAHKFLMEADCEAVPYRAIVYAQLVESPSLWKLHQLLPNILLPPADMSTCSGAASVLDIQLGRISVDDFVQLSPIIPMFSFEFSKLESSSPASCTRVVPCLHPGLTHCVFSWWDLQMDPEGKIVCSTAPRWACKKPEDAKWRDHWMQCLYFLPEAVSISLGDDLELTASHDSYTVWYSVNNGSSNAALMPTRQRPICSCLAHLLWNRARLGELNDVARTNLYEQALQKVIRRGDVCLSVGDGSLLPVMAAAKSFSKVFSVEISSMSQQVIKKVLQANDLTDSVEIINKRPEDISSDDLQGKKVSVLIAEPFFTTSLLPWHNVYFWYARSALDPLLRSDARILPHSATLHLMAVEFQDLWKIRAPVGECEGFDVSVMDEMIQASMEFREFDEIETHPLWEYHCMALSMEATALTLDFSCPLPDQPIENSGTLSLVRPGICHGLAVWMDFHLVDEIIYSTGLDGLPSVTGTCNWNRNCKQGVRFFRDFSRSEVQPSSDQVAYSITFCPKSGDVQLKCNINKID
uniref:protein arginine N-methyltransferase 7 isoform X1 n=2 Tax=Myxine glutinosa TaxID=7769 RepID=UPI00358E46C4